MPVDIPVKRESERKEWTVTGRFVLVTLVVFFLVVATVNGIMMTLAIKTFSGADARNGYDLSQNYNREIARAKEQASRGWGSNIGFVRIEDKARLTLTLRDRAGQPVSGLAVTALLRHPLNKVRDHQLDLREIAPGTYETLETGVAAGQWDVQIVGLSGTERVFTANSRATLN